MNQDQALDLLHDLLDDGLGISGHQVFNGADYYQCSVCYASTDTMGHAGATGRLSDVEHRPDCALVKLAEYVKSRQ